MKHTKEKAMGKGRNELSRYHINKFNKAYDEVIRQAHIENPYVEPTDIKRGRKKKGKVLALVERLEKYKASVCLFINDFKVPFTNNQAERDIRMIKVKTKVSGCFRNIDGAKDYLKIMSYVGTARKHSKNPFKAIQEAIMGNFNYIFIKGTE